MMLVRKAVQQDAADIQAIIHPGYYDESIFTHMTYDADALARFIQFWLSHDAYVVLCDGKVIGFGAIVFFKTFYKEEIGDVDMFCIVKEHRQTPAARMLRDALIDAYTTRGAKTMTASCGIGISSRNDKLYQNLWSKCGLKPVGTIMMRRS